jgi:hypothetical protein
MERPQEESWKLMLSLSLINAFFLRDKMSKRQKLGLLQFPERKKKLVIFRVVYYHFVLFVPLTVTIK